MYEALLSWPYSISRWQMTATQVSDIVTSYKKKAVEVTKQKAEEKRPRFLLLKPPYRHIPRCQKQPRYTRKAFLRFHRARFRLANNTYRYFHTAATSHDLTVHTRLAPRQPRRSARLAEIHAIWPCWNPTTCLWQKLWACLSVCLSVRRSVFWCIPYCQLDWIRYFKCDIVVWKIGKDGA
jgi:hypothetical protein